MARTSQVGGFVPIADIEEYGKGHGGIKECSQ